MTTNLRNLGRVVGLGLLAVTACAGTKLTDVGDIDGGGAAGTGGATGIGKAGATGNAGSSGKGGKEGTAEGGTGNVGGVPLGLGGHDDPYVPVEDGDGGADPGRGFVCEACELVAETPDIRGIWAANDRIYWIEYGSFDGLRNYQADGRLLSLAFDAEAPVVITDSLQGPTQLRVTDDYAYVIEDRSDSLHGEFELTSVNLDGGAIRVLQELPEGLDGITGFDGTKIPNPGNWFHRFFAAAAGHVFWRNGAVIYRLVEGDANPPTKFLETEEIFELLADDSTVYLHDDAGIESVSHDGGTPAPVWTSAKSNYYVPLSLVGDYFFAPDFSAGGFDVYFARLPTTGGTFQRLAEGGTPWINHLKTDGATYVVDMSVRAQAPMQPNDCTLTEGNILDPSSARRLASAPPWHEYDNDGIDRLDWRAWDATPTAVYLGYGDQLYRVARQSL